MKFNILNFSKPDSLFNYGMKVTMYSQRKSENEKIGWYKGCTEITYYSNGIKKDPASVKTYYSLSFSHTFEYSDDELFFAFCYPYTYSDLQEDIKAIESDP